MGSPSPLSFVAPGPGMISPPVRHWRILVVCGSSRRRCSRVPLPLTLKVNSIAETFYMLYAYPKNEQEDLTAQQLRILARLVREEFG